MAKKKYSYSKIIRDLVLVALSIYLTILVVRIGLLEPALDLAKELEYVGVFIVGMLFTSFFTIALASIVLVEMADTMPVLAIAFFGGLGAMVGDYIIFTFIRDFLADDIFDVVKHSPLKRSLHFLRLRVFRWVWPTLGAFIIVSPLPDEIGLAMMGVSAMPVAILLPLTFIFNFFGILLITGLAGVF